MLGPGNRSTARAIPTALQSWFCSLDGWRQAALAGGLAAGGWTFLIQLPTVVLTERTLTLSTVVATLGIALLAFFAPLWAWGMAFMYRPLLDQPERPESELLYAGLFGAVVQLVLGGLEAAIAKVVPSFAFLGSLPLAAARGMRRLGVSSGGPTEID